MLCPVVLSKVGLTGWGNQRRCTLVGSSKRLTYWCCAGLLISVICAGSLRIQSLVPRQKDWQGLASPSQPASLCMATCAWRERSQKEDLFPSSWLQPMG